MKRCPTCNRIYHDDSLNFCLEDGTSLSLWPDKTLVLPGAEQSNLAPTVPAGVSRQPEDAYGRQQSTLPVNQNVQAHLHQQGVGPAQPYYAQGDAAPPRKGSAALWLIPITAIALLAIAAILYSMSGRQSAGNAARSDNSSSRGSETTVSPTPAGTPTPPVFGFIKGKMAYPSDGIPGVMVACAENIETKETICSEKRKGWEERVSYSLQLPPGKYYVYGKLLPGDDSVGDMQNESAYYTDYMKCGMGATCTSHRRIQLEVRPGETLNGFRTIACALPLGLASRKDALNQSRLHLKLFMGRNVINPPILQSFAIQFKMRRFKRSCV
jgi:hypothetical protein